MWQLSRYSVSYFPSLGEEKGGPEKNTIATNLAAMRTADKGGEWQVSKNMKKQ